MEPQAGSCKVDEPGTFLCSQSDEKGPTGATRILLFILCPCSDHIPILLDYEGSIKLFL